MAEAPPRSPALLLYTLGREGGLPFARSAADPSSLFPLPSSLRPPPLVPPGFSHLPPPETSSPHRPVQWLSFSWGRQKSLPQRKPRKTGWGGSQRATAAPGAAGIAEDGYAGRWQILIAWTPSARPARVLCSRVNAACTHQAPRASGASLRLEDEAPAGAHNLLGSTWALKG